MLKNIEQTANNGLETQALKSVFNGLEISKLFGERLGQHGGKE